MSSFPDFTIKQGDCIEVMRECLPDESVDLIVTSPPYWNQMDYSHWPAYLDYLHTIEGVIWQCFRVLKPGRHCFWVIPDKLPWPPKESGKDERLYLPVYADTERAAARCGFVCKFPIVWYKKHGTQKMFGSYPYPPTIIPTPMTERICIWRKPGKPAPGKRTEENKIEKMQWIEWACDVWDIPPDSDPDHPAVYPLTIPIRVIKLWSFQGDLVLDPFCGRGTTGRASMYLLRRFYGIDINEKYARISEFNVRLAFNETNLLRQEGR